MSVDCRCSPQPPSPDVDNTDVFCSGSLLDRVQRSNMFPDSKHFVDMSCIYSPAQTMADFELFSNCARNDGSLEFLKMFVEKHFNEPGSELEPWTPPDWKAQPVCLSKVSDPEIKHFAAEINELWKKLGRRVRKDVQQNPDLYSLIYVPKPFIIPNENSREYRYWDSFWIIRGLLQCGMHQTARGMIENFLVLVQQYGYVPACGRIYAAERTHPPLLIMMVKAYVEVTKDDQFAVQSLPFLDTEFETFLSKHAIEVKGKTMYQYRDFSSFEGPRPEAYREDLVGAENMEDPKMREAYYTELKSASESGQEFSSRWFVTGGGSNEATLKDTKPSAIIPVELNAIIFRSGKILAEFHRKAGNVKKADEYQDRSCVLVKAIRDVLWNNQAGIWQDYDVVNDKPRNYFCCTNFAPLWARAFPLIDTDRVSKSVMEYIKTNKLDDLFGGVPHTMNKTAGEKWDYPNVFPPMMFLIVEGLENLGTRASKAMSKRWAHRWVKSNYTAYKSEGFMYERYYCREFGTSGEASPKNSAVGYGWTNAVIIEFLCKYGREISLSDDTDKGSRCKGEKKNSSFIITSEAGMDTQKNDKQDKKSCGCKADKSTAAMGNTRENNCGPSQQPSQTSRKRNDDCRCSISGKRSQAVQASNQSCPCDQDKRKSNSKASSKHEQQQEQQDPDCECQVEAQKKIEQLQKQTTCYQEQQKVKDRKEQQQSKTQDEDCCPPCKTPETQDCSQQMKNQAQSGCGCDDDEEQQRQDREAQKCGHYAPLADKSDSQDGGYGCGNADCPDAPEDDDSSNQSPAASPKSPTASTKSENCSCNSGGSLPQQNQASDICANLCPSFVCPHCGGIFSDPTPCASMQTVTEDKCDCSDCGQQMKGITSIGLQTNNCKSGGTETNRRRQSEQNCKCCCAQQMKGMSNIGMQSGNCKSGGTETSRRPQTEQNCDCSGGGGGGGGQQIKSMTTIGQQTSNCKSGGSQTSRRPQTDQNCDCPGGGGQQMKSTSAQTKDNCNNKMGPGPTKSDGAGKPKSSKVFPLADPDSN